MRLAILRLKCRFAPGRGDLAGALQNLQENPFAAVAMAGNRLYSKHILALAVALS
jgi:hypothetical protein